MSLSTAGVAASLASMQADATRHSITTALLKQQADAEASVVTMLEQSLQQAPASTPLGQGTLVDISA